MSFRSTNGLIGLFALGGVLVAGSNAGTSGPAAAAVLPFGETSCSSVSACLFGANASSGYGVEGSSKKGDGVVGITTVNATSPSAGRAGVSGYDSSTNKNTANSGIYGTSAYATGVQGKSSHGTGVYGSGLAYGVNGIGNTGVAGTSTKNGGTALSASSYAGADLLDAYQYYQERDPVSDGIVVTTAYGAGLSSTTSRGIPLYLDITDEGDTLIDAQTGGGQDEMVVDNFGNLYLAGSLFQNNAARFTTSRADGKTVVTYGSRETSPSLEDTGEVNVIRGMARVALDPSFASTIDPHRAYLVFVTPEGESASMYVTQKTAAGFVIRESGAARSTVAVQYRIVAQPLHGGAPRMPVVASVFPTSAAFAQEKRDLRQRSALRAQIRVAQTRQ